MRALKIKSVINPDTMIRKMNRASTLPAVLEALCGHNGKLSNISRVFQFRLVPALVRRGAIQADENKEQSADEDDRETGTQLQHVAHDRAVFSGCRIIVIAVQQHLIDGVSDLALRSFDEAHAQIFGREIDAVEIARDA